MTSDGSTARRWALQDALAHAKTARKALRSGDIPRAIQAWGLGLRSLYYGRGTVAHRGWNAITATAGLFRILASLGEQIEAAARPMVVEHAEAVDLVDDIAAGLEVWRKRGEVELTDEQILERSRNVAVGLTHRFVFTPIPDAGRN